MTQILYPFSSSAALDDGCGLGTVNAELEELFSNHHVRATDTSAGLIDVINYKTKKYGWKNVEAKVLNVAVSRVGVQSIMKLYED